MMIRKVGFSIQFTPIFKENPEHFLGHLQFQYRNPKAYLCLSYKDKTSKFDIELPCFPRINMSRTFLIPLHHSLLLTFPKENNKLLLMKIDLNLDKSLQNLNS